MSVPDPLLTATCPVLSGKKHSSADLFNLASRFEVLYLDRKYNFICFYTCTT